MNWLGYKDGSRIPDVAVGTGNLFRSLVLRNQEGENIGIEGNPIDVLINNFMFDRIAKNPPGC